MKKQITIFLFILLVLSSFVIAVKPETQIITGLTQGLIIEYPKYETTKQNQDFELHLHVFNETDGSFMTNDTTDCLIHIYNNSGHHVLEEDLVFDLNLIDFELFIGGGNFSILGEYAYIIQCNTSTYGGAASGLFEVTETGEADKENTGTADLAIMIFILSIAIGCFVAASKKEWSKNVYADLILKRSFSVLGLYFMVLNSAIAATIAVESGLPLASEMFGYMFILGIVGWLAMAYLVLRTFFDLFNTWKIINNEKRFG